MKAKDTERRYSLTIEVGRLIGESVGSIDLGIRIADSLLLPSEIPSEKNIQIRLREALQSGTLQACGLGPQRLKRLKSAVALGKALYIDVPELGAIVSSPETAANAFYKISWEPVEKFAVLVLDVKNRIISTRVISSGTATETLAYPKDVFRTVVQTHGVRCILAHNHPSGSLEPSAEDLVLTKQLLEAGKVIDIPVVDHLIVAHGEYTSIRQTTALWKDA